MSSGLSFRFAALNEQPQDGRRRGQPRCGIRWCLALSLAVVWTLLGSPGLVEARGAAVGEAVRAVHEAAAELESKAEALPRQAQLQVGTEVTLLTRATDRMLEQLAREPIAAASAGIEEDLLFLRDLLAAAGREVDRPGYANSRRSGDRLQQVSGVAEELIGAIRQSFEQRSAALDGRVVSAERTTDGLLLRSVDRMWHDGVRLAGLALALVGLLVIGLRFLSLSEAEISLVELVKQAPLAALGGMLAVGLFMASAVAITVDPGPVTSVVERTEHQTVTTSCERLAIQRRQLLDARGLGNQGLDDAVKDRMRPVAQACLGLDSQVAAVEAVEWLSTSLDPLTAGDARRAAGFRASTGVDAGSQRLNDARLSGDDGHVDANGEGSARGGPALDLAGAEVADRFVETTTRVNYRSGPSTDARRLGILQEGAEVVLLGETGSWSSIRLDDGSTVFVASEYLRAVP